MTPRLSARRFEEGIIGQICDDILTKSNIRDLVHRLDEEMDWVGREQRETLGSVEAALEEFVQAGPLPPLAR